MTDVPQGGQLRGAVDLSSLAHRASQNADEQSDVTVPSLIAEGTDSNFGDFLELSRTVPVVVDLWAEWCGPCKQLSPILDRVANDYGGRIVLVKVDVDHNPQLAQVFRAQSIPTVAALVGGQPVPLFAGAIPEPDVRHVVEQVLQVAAHNGVTGRVTVAGSDASEQQSSVVEEPLPPHHAAAVDAISRGDYAGAIDEYSQALAQNPGDEPAVTGLAKAKLLARLSKLSPDDILESAQSNPRDCDAQLAAADLDVSTGRVKEGFDRVLKLFPAMEPDDRERARERLLDLFNAVGVNDPRVVSARQRLSSLLY
jgi:putative thioredoxin